MGNSLKSLRQVIRDQQWSVLVQRALARNGGRGIEHGSRRGAFACELRTAAAAYNRLGQCDMTRLAAVPHITQKERELADAAGIW